MPQVRSSSPLTQLLRPAAVTRLAPPPVHLFLGFQYQRFFNKGKPLPHQQHHHNSVPCHNTRPRWSWTSPLQRPSWWIMIIPNTAHDLKPFRKIWVSEIHNISRY